MTFQEFIDQLPPQKDLMRIARAIASARRSSRGEPLFYAIAGLLIGAGIGLLFAPGPGSELRETLSERLEQYWSSANEALKSNGHAASDGR